MSALTLTKRSEKKQLISITALIDIVFILLLFFMLTSTFMKWRTLSLETSSTDGAEIQKVDTPPTIIKLHAAGTFDMSIAGENTKTLQQSELNERLARMTAQEKEASFIIQSGEQVTTQQIIAVFDALKVQQVSNFTLGDVFKEDTFINGKR